MVTLNASEHSAMPTTPSSSPPSCPASSAGPDIEAVRAHWPGTEDGFAALTRLSGLDTLPTGRS
ncbi:MAG: hypothetical protein ABWY20_12790, partial [Mycobacterium sp.]